MKNNSFFACKDYREALEIQRNLQKELTPKKYSIQSLAEAATVHRSYLSKVMHKKAHLSEDQLYLAMEFLGFDEKKTEFTELLYRWQRSEIASRKNQLENKIKKYNLESVQHISKEERKLKVSQQDRNNFYLNPHALVVFLFLTIKRYRENPKAIMKELDLDEATFTETVDFIERVGIIQRTEDEIVVLQEHISFGFDTEVIDAFHAIARNRSYQKMLAAPKDQKNVYTSLFTVPRDSYQQIRELRARFLKDFIQLVETSPKGRPDSTLYEFHCDIFPWVREDF